MKLIDLKKTSRFLTSCIALSGLMFCSCSKPLDDNNTDTDGEDTVAEVVLTDFQPQTGGVDNIITITGKNFGTDKSNIRVTFGGQNVVTIQELTDTKLVVNVPVVDVTEDTPVDLTVTVGDVSKTFDKKFSYVWVPYPGIWISGSFNGWSTDVSMEKDPTDPYTFHFTTDLIPSTPDENGERAFKFLTKSISWVWGNTYNSVQEKAPITDTRVVFQKNAGQDGKDFKWEFKPWECGHAYEISLSIKPGEEKMTCTPVDGEIVAPKEYSTVSTLNTTEALSDFRGMDFTVDGKLVVVSGWEKIFTVDPENGKTELLYNMSWEWEQGGPRELNGMCFSKDKNTLYLACPNTTKGAGDIYYLSKDSEFAKATAIVTGLNKYSSTIAVNPNDGTIIFNAMENGESFYRVDDMEGKITKLEGMKSLGGSNGGSRLYFNADGTKMYRLIYEGNDIWDLGVIYSYDYDAATKTFKNETLVAGADLEPGCVDGKGAEARFRRPYGATMDSFGNLYIADCDNHCIRKVDSEGNVTTFAGANEAGSADGELLSARFAKPASIVVSPDGTIYVGQNGSGDHPACIRIIK